jgi:hypothetical protein
MNPDAPPHQGTPNIAIVSSIRENGRSSFVEYGRELCTAGNTIDDGQAPVAAASPDHGQSSPRHWRQVLAGPCRWLSPPRRRPLPCRHSSSLRRQVLLAPRRRPSPRHCRQPCRQQSLCRQCQALPALHAHLRRIKGQAPAAAASPANGQGPPAVASLAHGDLRQALPASPTHGLPTAKPPPHAPGAAHQPCRRRALSPLSRPDVSVQN